MSIPRPDSFLVRLFSKSDNQGSPAFDMAQCAGRGMPAFFRPKESLAAYGNNTCLYRSFLPIAMQVGRTQFRRQRSNAKGEIEYIQTYQAVGTLALPQPIESGKSMLTAMLVKVITEIHLMLNGKAWWLLLDRLKASGAPTRIKLFLSW